MTNKDINKKVSKAFENATPDVLDSILSNCDEQKGTMIYMTENKKSKKWIPYVATIAAAFILVLGGVFGTQEYMTNYKVASTVSLDVNPSIEIKVNKKDKVIAVNALNEDARIVIDDMDFKGSSLDITVNALVGSMLKNGYINDITNSILVSVDADNQAKGSNLQQKLTDEINSLINTDNFSGAVLSQTVAHDNELEKLADTYGITLGKAQLIRQITTQNTLYAFKDLVALSINELNLLSESGNLKLDNIQSIGTASDKAYIGKISAKEIALKHVGAKESDITQYECELDYENGVMVYEIDFSFNGYEYEYDINALTGEIVNSDKELDDIDDDNNNNDNNINSNKYIGKSKAKEVAISHAKVDADKIRDYECELDRKNGTVIYEISFEYDNYEYEYDINALNGAVVKYDKELND